MERDVGTGSDIRLVDLILKTSVVHTVTYFVAGAAAMTLYNYEQYFNEVAQRGGLLRSFDDPILMAGPLFQPIRGVIFALAFYPIRSVIFVSPYGWLILWWILIALGILSTFGAAPNSIESLIYTTRTPDFLNVETEVQALGLAGFLWLWVRHPERRWFGWLMWGSFAMIVVMISMGLLQRFGYISA